MPKCVGSRGSALDPAGGAHDAPPSPLVDWRGDTPSPNPTPSAPRAHDAPPGPLVDWGGDTPSPNPTPSAPRFSRLRRSLRPSRRLKLLDLWSSVAMRCTDCPVSALYPTECSVKPGWWRNTTRSPASLSVVVVQLAGTRPTVIRLPYKISVNKQTSVCDARQNIHVICKRR